MLKHIKILFFTATVFSLGYIVAPNPQNLRQYYENNPFDLVKVVDGDTLHISRIAGEIIKVRLHGIDTPERGKNYFEPAKQALLGLCAAKPIRLKRSQADNFGRITANVYCGETHVNASLLTLGAAIVSIKYADQPEFYALQMRARRDCRGVWAHDLKVNYTQERLAGKTPDKEQRIFKSRPDCLIKTAENLLLQLQASE